MSRLTKHTERFVIAYGYDNPLQEYFVQKFDKTKSDERDENIVYSLSTNMNEVNHPDYPKRNRTSRGQMLEILEQEGFDKKDDIMWALAMDLPI